MTMRAGRTVVERYRTFQDWESLGGADKLTAPEHALIDACRNGVPCKLGDGSRPTGHDPARTIRADLLRYLILGGCDNCRVAEAGVVLKGAYIRDHLDLDFVVVKGQTSLTNCRFAVAISALQTRFELLNLGGTALPRLNADGVKVIGSVILNRGFAATEGVSLVGAKIGVQLACGDGHFENAGGRALDALGVEVNGSIYLLREFRAAGEVCLVGARIGGRLACDNGQFENADGYALNAERAEISGGVFLRYGFKAVGEVRLAGARIGDRLTCEGGHFQNANGDALNAQRLRVEGSIIWRNVMVPEGGINIDGAHVGDLVDDAASWPAPDGAKARLILDGFTYNRISNFTDTQTRLSWLASGTRWNGEFFPQPYTQLAKVLREMGHDRAAREVRMRQEQLIRQNIRVASRIAPNGDLDVAVRSLWADVVNLVRWLWDLILRIVTGYGHAPVRSFIVLGLLFVVATSLANRTWNEGSFAPNSAIILASKDWRDLADDPAIANPADTWSANGAAGQDWETFNRYAYGFDLVVPILTLGQTGAWAPSTTRGWWGRQLWWARWLLLSLGWIVTALGAAAITGIISRD
jgi:hypothetical protein